MINVFEPQMGQAEINAITDTFKSHWVGKGEKVTEFEWAWANHLGVKSECVTSVSCATEGLFQIVDILPCVNTKKNQEIIIPAIHFIGAYNAIKAAGYIPVVCDVDKFTLNPSLYNIRMAATESTCGVLLLHYGGVAQELDTIRQWCDYWSVWLIEDAACSPITVYKCKPAGTHGQFGVWSFDAMKILSCGDGGMIYCEEPDYILDLKKRMYLGLNNHSGLLSPADRWWEFTSDYPGRRAIMNDISASIGLEQLNKLGRFVARRRGIVHIYNQELSGLSKVLRLPYIPDGSSPYFYWVQTFRRDELARFLREADVYTTFRYYPLGGFDLPGVKWAAENTLLLPLHCGLTDDQVYYICGKIKEFYGAKQ